VLVEELERWCRGTGQSRVGLGLEIYRHAEHGSERCAHESAHRETVLYPEYGSHDQSEPGTIDPPNSASDAHSVSATHTSPHTGTIDPPNSASDAHSVSATHTSPHSPAYHRQHSDTKQSAFGNCDAPDRHEQPHSHTHARTDRFPLVRTHAVADFPAVILPLGESVLHPIREPHFAALEIADRSAEWGANRLPDFRSKFAALRVSVHFAADINRHSVDLTLPFTNRVSDSYTICRT
jgi:hypothetical protein